MPLSCIAVLAKPLAISFAVSTRNSSRDSMIGSCCYQLQKHKVQLDLRTVLIERLTATLWKTL